MNTRTILSRTLGIALAAMLIAPASARAPIRIPVADFGGIEFGDDASASALDGECDDMRFTGDGMTETPLLAEDLYHDATDCHAAFTRSQIALAPLFVRLSGASEIVWGDDNGDFARDGECDDLRFEGPGMTDTPLISEDVGHDASDCRAAYKKGVITWRVGAIGQIEATTLLT